ncbi:MAG TPA: AMP-binding protein, partial [Burkholderiaceae bacterium]|nr:AMP-binding protein [Burkholderiaceae bacterium]
MPSNIYDHGLDRTPANYAPLTPLGFLERAASVYPQRTAILHGTGPDTIRRTWRETYARCRRLAHALTKRGLGRGDTVAVLLANTPEMAEAHFGVPMAGCVLNTINTRLDVATIAFILEHGEAKLFIVDREFAAPARAALAQLKQQPEVIDVLDPLYQGAGDRLGKRDYEALLAEGDPEFEWQPPADEWDAIALNYTSGTTGNPKGVVYHHRGAYLNAVSNIITWGMPQHPT